MYRQYRHNSVKTILRFVGSLAVVMFAGAMLAVAHSQVALADIYACGTYSAGDYNANCPETTAVVPSSPRSSTATTVTNPSSDTVQTATTSGLSPTNTASPARQASTGSSFWLWFYGGLVVLALITAGIFLIVTMRHRQRNKDAG